MAVLDSEAFQRKSFGPTPVARQSGKSMTENPPRVAQTGATCTSYKLLILLAPQVKAKLDIQRRPLMSADVFSCGYNSH